jgi:hypothetical protein
VRFGAGRAGESEVGASGLADGEGGDFADRLRTVDALFVPERPHRVNLRCTPGGAGSHG